MPTLKKIKDTMKKQKIAADIMSQMDFDADSNDPKKIIAVIDKMDELLTKEQCLSVMEQQGCCKTGERDANCKAFAVKYADKTLAEKVELLSTVPYMMRPVLDSVNNTITVTYWGFQNGVHKGRNTCSCGTIKKLSQPFTVSPTYCGCCAGHFRYHYQNALGVKLKLISIPSSPLNTNCEGSCQFVFKIYTQV
ncbi:MAG: hypothetical protein PHX51_08215 [Clostridia bacterium]|nr:hypothetical protein [Clostridia bacterium]